MRRAEGSATLDSAQGYTGQRDVLLLKRWRDLAAIGSKETNEDPSVN